MPQAKERCGKSMPRTKECCARGIDHKGACRTTETIARAAQYRREWLLVPANRSRYREMEMIRLSRPGARERRRENDRLRYHTSPLRRLKSNTGATNSKRRKRIAAARQEGFLNG